MTDDWKMVYSYNGVPITPDWKLEVMGRKFTPKCILNKITGEFEKIPNSKESIKIKFEFTKCNNCKTDTRQIILSDVSNYPIDKTISRTQKFRCGCGKINERIIYGCDKCERCTVQSLVRDFRNNSPETLEESQFLLKRFQCKECKTFNDICPDTPGYETPVLGIHTRWD